MFRPIGASQAGDHYAVGGAGVDELIITDVNAHVRNPFFVCIFEKDEVAWLRLVHIIGTVVVAGSRVASDFLSCLIRDVVDVAAAIETGKRAAAPHVRNPH